MKIDKVITKIKVWMLLKVMNMFLQGNAVT